MTAAAAQRIPTSVPQLILSVTGMCLGVTDKRLGKRCKVLI
jgi:hypothetical protein